jgi:hypothetical protein
LFLQSGDIEAAHLEGIMATIKEKEVIDLGSFELEEDPAKNKRKIQELLESIKKNEEPEKIGSILKKKKKKQIALTPAPELTNATPSLRPDSFDPKRIKFIGKILNANTIPTGSPHILNSADIRGIYKEASKDGTVQIKGGTVGGKVCGSEAELTKALLDVPHENTEVTIDAGNKTYKINLSPPSTVSKSPEKQTAISELNTFRVVQTEVAVTKANVYTAFESMIGEGMKNRGSATGMEMTVAPQKFINDLCGPESGTEKNKNNLDLHDDRMVSFHNNLKQTVGKMEVGESFKTDAGAKFTVTGKTNGSITVLFEGDKGTMEVKINLPDKKKFTDIKYDEKGLDQNYVDLMKSKNPKVASLIDKTFLQNMNKAVDGDIQQTNDRRVEQAVKDLQAEANSRTPKVVLTEKDIADFKKADAEVRAYQRTGKLEIEGEVKYRTNSWSLKETDKGVGGSGKDTPITGISLRNTLPGMLTSSGGLTILLPKSGGITELGNNLGARRDLIEAGIDTERPIQFMHFNASGQPVANKLEQPAFMKLSYTHIKDGKSEQVTIMATASKDNPVEILHLTGSPTPAELMLLGTAIHHGHNASGQITIHMTEGQGVTDTQGASTNPQATDNMNSTTHSVSQLVKEKGVVAIKAEIKATELAEAKKAAADKSAAKPTKDIK